MADPGFPRGGGRGPVRAWSSDVGAFGENVCENERIGSRRGRRVLGTSP